LTVIVQAVLVGMLVVIAGTIPRDLLFAANLRFFDSTPWAVPIVAVYLLALRNGRRRPDPPN
jgi:hypothetical protein